MRRVDTHALDIANSSPELYLGKRYIGRGDAGNFSSSRHYLTKTHVSIFSYGLGH